MGTFYPPSGPLRYSIKEGFVGTDVAALQLNLGYAGPKVSVDGVCGPTTTTAIIAFQTKSKLVADGIAGPLTQRYLCVTIAAPFSATHRLPKYLLSSLVENESGWQVGAVSWNKTDAGTATSVDLGWIQDNVSASQFSNDRFKLGFDGSVTLAATCAELRTFKDKFYTRINQAGSGVLQSKRTHRYAWELAVLNHNWPYAADRLSRGLEPVAVGADSPADWVIKASGGRLSTPRQWIDSYIAKATVYVTTWPA